MNLTLDLAPYKSKGPAHSQCPVVKSPPPATTGACYHASPLHFTGKERDSESGLDYFGVRYFASSFGRFASPDEPLADQNQGDPQSWNLYNYVRNNPLSNSDPDGRRCKRDANGNFQGDTCDQNTETGNTPDKIQVKSSPLPPAWLQRLGLDRHYNSAQMFDGNGRLNQPLGAPIGPIGPIGSLLGEAPEELTLLAKFSAILRAAAASKGMGPAAGEAVEVTAAEAEELGKAWVGSGARVASDGKSLVSSDGLRIYRPPTFKPGLSRVQANLEQKP